MGTITQALTAEVGAVSATLRQLLWHPLLWIAIHVRVAIALGIVYLMTIKPDLGGSLLTIAIATLLGIVVGLPAARRNQAQDAPAA
jgi:hypothetical protein